MPTAIFVLSGTVTKIDGFRGVIQPVADILPLLEEGEINLIGLVSWGSNYTFLTDVCYQGREAQAIYKPQRGERPLWDFADGTLCLRERAAFLLSEALGWSIVPPTVLRQGPHGWGSVQLFMDHIPDQHYFTFEGRFPDQLQQIALFDVLANNADRKGGHVLLDSSDRLWAIDHGICFHADYKLRTVIWEFAGRQIPDWLQVDLENLDRRLVQAESYPVADLAQVLSAGEFRALRRRLRRLLRQPLFPEPGPGRPYPWPLV